MAVVVSPACSQAYSLNAAGLYVILDLHWTAPGTKVADGQRPMPDDHSGAFWASVASTLKANPAVVFDAFSNAGEPPDNNTLYTPVGMQYLVDQIRATGATQPILLGGLTFAMTSASGWPTSRATPTIS